MKTINIKGKDYTPVHERILYFWEQHPEWAIETEIINFDNEIANIKAIIKDETGRIRATGHAFELQTDKNSFVNKTSYLENAETSAIGRALGSLGIGIENSFASANEVKSAVENQNNPELEKPWLTEKQLTSIINCIHQGEWPNKNFPEQSNAKDAFEYIQSKFRIKKQYRESIQAEVDSPFNQTLLSGQPSQESNDNKT